MGKDKRPTFVTATPRSDITPETIKILDDFIHHFYNGDYEIDLAAFKVTCADENKEASLGQFLTMSTRDYVATKSDTESKRRNDAAGELLTWMTHARGLGLIKDGKSALTRLQMCEEENKRLRDTQQKLQVEIMKGKEENEELHKALDQFGERTNVDEE